MAAGSFPPIHRFTQSLRLMSERYSPSSSTVPRYSWPVRAHQSGEILQHPVVVREDLKDLASGQLFDRLLRQDDRHGGSTSPGIDRGIRFDIEHHFAPTLSRNLPFPLDGGRSGWGC